MNVDQIFSTELLSNQIFNDQPLTFSPQKKEQVNNEPVNTGAFVQPNGDVQFRIYAPSTNVIRLLSLQQKAKGTRELFLKKQCNGMFEGVLSFCEECTGPATINLYFDGTLLLYPYLPIYWTASRPCNYIEIPDTDTEFMHIKNVPHGAVSREIYWSDVTNLWERCTIYTPPGYMKSNQEYPVLYLLSGGGDNEICWEYTGRIAHILDNLIAEKKCEPFLVVMNNGMRRFKEYAGNIVDEAFERILVESCVPYIENNYRVKSGKWNRAIAGLSMGAFMTSDIGFRHPNLFGYMGHFTASMTELNLKMTYERPYMKAMQDSVAFAENYKVYFRSTTPLEDHFDYFKADDEICLKAKIDQLSCYHRVVYPPHTSKWNSWRMGVRDFAQLIFW